MPTLLRFVIAAAIVLAAATEVRGNDKPIGNKRYWRVVYCEDDFYGPCYKGRRLSVTDCVAELRKIYSKDKIILTCTAEATNDEKQADEEERDVIQVPTPK
jgi:hypothetical protein